ncbi:hypothetical protein QG37_06302 [Candidozyma auris]|nr:hypothetical protein QG37_06302 [[Candida] auris]
MGKIRAVQEMGGLIYLICHRKGGESLWKVVLRQMRKELLTSFNCLTRLIIKNIHDGVHRQ